jgi:hypothetical protein
MDGGWEMHSCYILEVKLTVWKSSALHIELQLLDKNGLHLPL